MFSFKRTKIIYNLENANINIYSFTFFESEKKSENTSYTYYNKIVLNI